MVVVIAYLLNLFAPIVNIVGLLGLIGAILYEDIAPLIYGGIAAVVGLIFGVFAYRNDIPPRWTWSKSRNQLFGFAVTTVLGYALNVAAWPLAVYMVGVIINKM